jgi:hypothetical protein
VFLSLCLSALSPDTSSRGGQKLRQSVLSAARWLRQGEQEAQKCRQYMQLQGRICEVFFTSGQREKERKVIRLNPSGRNSFIFNSLHHFAKYNLTGSGSTKPDTDMFSCFHVYCNAANSASYVSGKLDGFEGYGNPQCC